MSQSNLLFAFSIIWLACFSHGADFSAEASPSPTRSVAFTPPPEMPTEDQITETYNQICKGESEAVLMARDQTLGMFLNDLTYTADDTRIVRYTLTCMFQRYTEIPFYFPEGHQKPSVEATYSVIEHIYNSAPNNVELMQSIFDAVLSILPDSTQHHLIALPLIETAMEKGYWHVPFIRAAVNELLFMSRIDWDKSRYQNTGRLLISLMDAVDGNHDVFTSLIQKAHAINAAQFGTSQNLVEVYQGMLAMREILENMGSIMPSPQFSP